MELIPERIKLARRICSYSMDDLVRQMGERAVSKMAISKIERGLMHPSEATLQAIADACRQPVSFFYKASHDLGALEFRFKANVTDRQREEIRARVTNLLQDYFELQTLEGNIITFVHPARGITLRNFADAEEAALRLRRKWDIGLQPIHSVYELLACNGFHVLELDFGSDNILGLSTFAGKDTPIIIINTRVNTTTERKRFTALHEVCHILFRLRPDNEQQHQAYLATLPPIPYPVTIKQPTEERLCEHFASAMLIPEPCILRRFGKMRTNISLEEFKATRNLYGISVAAQVHRLHDLRVIDDTLYNFFYDKPIKKNRMEYGWGEYPIMETADRYELLSERSKIELKTLKI